MVRRITARAVLATMAILACRVMADGPPATQPAVPDPRLPKGALILWGRSLPAGGLAKALEIYMADTDDEKVVARAMAQMDLAESELEKLVRDKWGGKAGDEVIRAMRDQTEEDVAQADEQKDGDDRVVITFRDPNELPLTMVKVHGTWKASVAEMIKAADVSAQELAQFCRDVTGDVQLTIKEFKAGDFPTLDALKRTVSRRIGVLIDGPDHKPDNARDPSAPA